MGINGDLMGFDTCLIGFHDYFMVTSWSYKWEVQSTWGCGEGVVT